MFQHDFKKIAEQHDLKTTIERYGVKFKYGKACCPFHEDKNPSFSLFRADDGSERWKCHPCDIHGDVVDFVARIEGIERMDAARRLAGKEGEPPKVKPHKVAKQFNFAAIPDHELVKFRPNADTPPMLNLKTGEFKTQKPSFVYVYRNEDGLPVGLVLRFNRVDDEGKPAKTFTQVRYVSEGHFVMKGYGKDDEQPPLYGAHLLKQHPDLPVLVVEGEKCADIVNAVWGDRVVGVTWMGGSSMSGVRHMHQLNGRDVTYWPDNSEDGVRAMERARKGCRPSLVHFVPVPGDGKAKGWDVADLLNEVTADEAFAWYQSRRKPEHEPSTEVATEQSWLWLPPGQQVVLTEKGEVNRSNSSNTELVLRYHPKFTGRLSYDVFLQEVTLDGEPLKPNTGLRLQREILNETSLTPRMGDLMEVVMGIAHDNKEHRLANYLRQLATTWDQKPRFLLRDYARCEDMGKGEWVAVVERRFMVGLVARIMEPGCKHDLVLVLEGPQGYGKSTFLATLAKIAGLDLHTELYSIREKVVEKLAGKAIVELPEMHGHRKAEYDYFKGWVSERKDTHRRPYSRFPDVIPRACVFVGTTNEKQYLTDPTGNRRMMPVRVTGPIDMKRLERDLLQIWAEAVSRYLQGDQHHLRPDEEELQLRELSPRQEASPWEDQLETALINAKRPKHWLPEEPYQVLGIPLERRNVLAREVRQAMAKLGYEQKKMTSYGGKRMWVLMGNPT